MTTTIDPTLLLALAAAVVVVAVVARQSKRSSGSACTGDLLAEVNAWRARGATDDNGRHYPPAPPVRIDGTLQAIAEQTANDLATHQIPAGHIGSDGSTFPQRLSRAGFRCSWAGENTAHNTRDAARTIAAFAASPTHAPTLMDPQSNVCGVACAQNGGAYWVNLMARV